MKTVRFSFWSNGVYLGAFLLATSAMAVGCGSAGPTATKDRPTSAESVSGREKAEEEPPDSSSAAPVSAGAEASKANATAEPVKVLRLGEVRDQIEAVAQRWYGVPYEWGGESKDGVDCSAFVQRVYKQAFSYRLPRVTETQVQTGSKVPRSQVRPGDLVFFRPENEWNHVGVYLGDGTFAHASSSDGVTKAQLSASYWKRYYWTTRRPLKPSVLPDSLRSELVAYQYPYSTARADTTGRLASGQEQKGKTEASEAESSGSETITIASCRDPDVECANPSQSSSDQAVASADTTTRKGW